MKRFIRRFAAWVLMKTGPIALMVKPRCGVCGYQFNVIAPDITPTILFSIKRHEYPGVSVGPAHPPTRFPQRDDSALRN